MKMKMFLMVCCCLTAAVHGAMFITNGDFETDAPTGNVTNVVGWFDTISATPGNWWEATWYGPTVSPNGTSVMGLSWMWQTPNWAYQGIGVNDDGYGAIFIGFDCGSFTDAGGLRNMGVTVSVYQSDGTFVGADNVDIDGAAGVTLIDSVSVTSGALAAGQMVPLSVMLDLSEANTSDELFLRFINFSTGTGEPWVAIDNVTLETPAVAFPSPANNAEAVLLNADLSWTVNNLNTAYIDLYFGTENEPNLVEVPEYKKLDGVSATITSYDPGTLDNDVVYYWRIDAYEPNSAPGATDYLLTVGPVWSFTTIGPAPYIVQHPAPYTLVESGQTVDLTVTAESYSPEDYQWYVTTVPVQDPDTDTPVGGLSFNGNVTLTDVQAEDEGYYYCVVTNQVGAVSSNMARVAVRRLLAHLPMDSIDDDVTPDTVSGFDMTLMNDLLETNLAALADGVDELGGNSILFDNTVSTDPNFWGQYGILEPGVVNYEDITVSVWVYWNGGSNWQRIIDFGNDTSNYMFLTPSHGSQCRFAVLAAGGTEQFVATTALPTGEWVHVTATLQGDTGRLYVNGELRATNTAMTVNPIAISPALNYVGRSQWATDPYFNGRIDDLMIYNYARTTEQIALDYLAVRGEWVCDQSLPALTYDFDGDCRVGLSDFAMFAEEWLDSNRIYLP